MILCIGDIHGRKYSARDTDAKYHQIHTAFYPQKGL